MHPLLPPDLQTEYHDAGFWGSRSVAALLADRAQQHPDRAAVVGEVLLTYAELDARARSLAGALDRHGIGRDDRIVAVMSSGWLSMVVQLAASRIGAVVAPQAPTTTPQRASNVIALLEATVLIIGDGIKARDQWKAALNTVPTFAPSVRMTIGTSEWLDSGAVTAVDDLLAEPFEFDECRLRPDEVSTILSTGGTTGPPKAVMQSDNGFLYSARCFASGFGLGEDLVYVCTGPYGHLVTAGWMLALPVLVGGAALPFPRWDAQEAAEAFHKYRGNFATLTSTHIFDFLELPRGSERLLKGVPALIAAGKPDYFFDEFEARFGVIPIRAYGQSEVPMHTMVDLQNRSSHGNSDGRPLAGVDLHLVQPGSRDLVEPGEPGEALVRGPGLFHGYYGDPEATAAAVTADGFYRTGDLVVERSGGVRVTGRVRDLIRRGGLTIDPSEVETLLSQHPSVHECVVVGVTDARLGERPVAAVVLEPGAALDLEGAVEYLTANGLATAYLPEALEQFDALVKTDVAKYDKVKIREAVEGRPVKFP